MINIDTVNCERARVKARRELWQWFAGLALAAFLIEWVLYVQRIRVEDSLLTKPIIRIRFALTPGV